VIQQLRDEHQPKSVLGFNAIIRTRQKSEQVSSESITCLYRKPGQLQRAAGLSGDQIAQCDASCGVGVVGIKIGRSDAKAARVTADWKRDSGALINW
jgi:hypothetical protein